MRLLIPILIAVLLGCDDLHKTSRPVARPTATTSSSTQAALKPIELQYGIYLARLDLRITVSADGVLHSVRTDNKTYGPNDIDPKYQRVEVREGRLTGEQMADLARLFEDWDSLSSEPYGGVPDGGDVSIRYGDKTVSGGSAVPQQVTDIRVRLAELAQSMPVMKP